MSSRLVWAVLVGMFLVMAATGPLKMMGSDTVPEQQPAPEVPDRVGMAGLAFSPDDLRVERGTELTFVNDDSAPHTVTAQDGVIDSGILNPGSSFRLVVNSRFEYRCLIHPAMSGRVSVG